MTGFHNYTADELINLVLSHKTIRMEATEIRDLLYEMTTRYNHLKMFIRDRTEDIELC